MRFDALRLINKTEFGTDVHGKLNCLASCGANVLTVTRSIFYPDVKHYMLYHNTYRLPPRKKALFQNDTLSTLSFTHTHIAMHFIGGQPR